MSDAFSPEVSDRICQHMNADHADAVLLFAKTLGGAPDATSATMLAINSQGMDLSAIIEAHPVRLRVTFDHTLKDAEDAHQTLIAMAKQART